VPKGMAQIVDAEILDPGPLAGSLPRLLGVGLVRPPIIGQEHRTGLAVADDVAQHFYDLTVQGDPSGAYAYCLCSAIHDDTWS
jgi:hypothetical protein